MEGLKIKKVKRFMAESKTTKILVPFLHKNIAREIFSTELKG